MRVRAYGKLNLTLAVTGRRGGLHTIESVMTTVSVYDEVEAVESDRVEVVCPEVPSEGNIAFRAAKLVEEAAGLSLRVVVRKGIPIGGGMGGSSADGAAVLAIARKLCEGRGIALDVKPLATRLGSDVNFMLGGGACIVGGTGDEVRSFKPAIGFTALVVNCGEVGTAECYKTFDALDVKCGGDAQAVAGELVRGILPSDGLLFNDLTPAARALNPSIARAEGEFKRLGLTPHLTGSGGCLFALTADEDICAAFKRLGYPAFFVGYVPRGVEIIDG